MRTDQAVRYVLTLAALALLLPLAAPPLGALWAADNRPGEPGDRPAPTGEAGEVPMDVQAVGRMKPMTYRLRGEGGLTDRPPVAGLEVHHPYGELIEADRESR